MVRMRRHPRGRPCTHAKLESAKSESSRDRSALARSASGVLAVIALVLLGSGSLYAAQFHVRTDGSDNCDGLADAPAGAGSCAFRTPAHAAQSIAPGDDIMIHQGSYAPFALPGQFRPNAGNPTIIEGDPGVDRNLVVIQAVAADREAIYSPGGGRSSERTRYVTLRHMRVTGGYRYAIHFDNEHEDITIEDIYLDGFGAICCTNYPSGTARPPRASAIKVLIGDRILMQDIEMVGHQNVPRLGVDATDAQSIFCNCNMSNFRRIISRNFHGNFLQENGHDNIIEHNLVENSTCDGDDGCVQVYHDRNTIVRYNIFKDIAITDAHGVVKLRRSGSTPPNAFVYNNTFISHPNAASHLRLDGVFIHSTGAGSGDTVIRNNIFVGWGNANYNDSGAILLEACPDGALVIDNNLYFNNERNLTNAAGCSGTFDGNSFFTDPQLDIVTLAPLDGNVACIGGDAGYVAWDGGRASQYIGAVPCTSSPTVNVPPRIDSFIATPSIALVDEPVTFEVDAIDPDDLPPAGLVCSFGFGDGSPSTGPMNCGSPATHTYTSDGQYTAIVTASDGLDSVQALTSIQVDQAPTGNHPPQLVCGANPTGGTVPLSVEFSCSASDPDGDTLAFIDWDFGDGASQLAAVGATVTHTYQQAGTYPVTATVSDGTVSTTDTLTITAAPIGNPSTTHVVSNLPGRNCSDAGPGTDLQPLCTIQAALASTFPGDTVSVQGGTYGPGELRIDVSGTAGLPVTIRSDPTLSAKIFGPSGPGHGDSPGERGVYIAGSHVVFDGFEVFAAAGSGIRNAGDYVTIRRNYVHDNARRCDPAVYTKCGQGIVSNRGDSRQGNQNVGVVIESNISDDNGSGSGAADHGFYISGPSMVLRNNVAVGSNDFGYQIYPDCDGCLIYNNVAFSNGRSGFLVGGDNSLELYSSNIRISNNISIGNTLYGFQFYQPGSETITMKNNISWSNGAGNISMPGQWNGLDNSEFILEDPLLVDPTALDFHLQSGSPAIDAGDGSLFAPTDIDGDTRPKGAGVDIGVDEVPVLNGRPSVEVDAAPATGVAPLFVSFTNTLSDPDGDPVKVVAYNFGDGQAIVTASYEISHTYALPGTYAARVLVADDRGLLATDSVLIQVLPNDPPEVSLAATPDRGRSPLMSTFATSATDPDGDSVSVVGYFFGDGTPPMLTSLASVTHNYTTPGTYRATAIVADQHGTLGSASTEITVTLNGGPTAVLTASPQSGEAPLTTFFTTTATDPDGDPLSYYFEFGDGVTSTSSGPGITHTYNGPGTYTAVVTVTDGLLNTTAQTTVEVLPAGGPNHAPVVSWSVSPPYAERNEDIVFTIAVNDPDGDALLPYLFDFDDREERITTTSPQVTYFFRRNGEYNAQVTVTDVKGSSTATGGQIVIGPFPPENLGPRLSLSASRITGKAPLTVTFTASATDPEGDNLNPFTYTFGDGAGVPWTIFQQLTHTYSAPGTYMAQVTLTDSNDNPATVSLSITVTP